MDCGKTPFLVVALALVAVALFATGQSERAESAELEMMYFTAAREEPYEEIIGIYQDQNPQVQVSQRVIPSYANYYQLLNTSIQAGNAPDLFYTHGNKNVQLQRLVEAGAVLDLTGKLDTTGYPSILVGKAIVNGRMYSSPGAFFDVVPVYYNRTVFEEHGLSEPSTYEELLQTAGVLQQNGEIPFALGGRSAWDAFWMLNAMVTSMASDWVEEFIEGNATFSDPRYVDVHEALITDIIEGGLVDPNFRSVDGAGARLLFLQGRAAMIVDGSWQARAMQGGEGFETSVFHWPDREGGNVMLGSQETGFSIYSGSDYQDEALGFLQYMMSEPALQILADLGTNVPGVDGIVSSDPLIQEMTQYDRVVDQFWNYITFFTRDGYDAPNDYVSLQQEVLYDRLSVTELVRQVDEMLEF